MTAGAARKDSEAPHAGLAIHWRAALHKLTDRSKRAIRCRLAVDQHGTFAPVLAIGRKVKIKSCRVCGADVFWWRTPTGAWQQYGAAPIPFDGSVGLALTRSRGLVDAGSAWPEPPYMFPSHWHPKRKESPEPAHVADVFAEFWRTRTPRQLAAARRNGNVA